MDVSAVAHSLSLFLFGEVSLYSFVFETNRLLNFFLQNWPQCVKTHKSIRHNTYKDKSLAVRSNFETTFKNSFFFIIIFWHFILAPTGTHMHPLNYSFKSSDLLFEGNV